MRKHLFYRSFLSFGVWFLLAALLCILYTDVHAAEDYKYGYNILEWKDTVCISDDSYIYAIKDDDSKWLKMAYDGLACDYFAEEDTVYFVKNDDRNGFIYSYNLSKEKREVLRSVEPGSRLIGKIDNKLYFLEQDTGTEDFEGKTLKSYNLSTEKEESLASGIGNAKFWNNIIVMSGMTTDISPVNIMMMDKNEKFAMVDEDCVSDFYVGEEGFYYLRYEMTSATSWSGITLCTVGDSRKSIAKITGTDMSASFLQVKDGFVDLVCSKNGKSEVCGVEVETGELLSVDVPDEGKIPSVYQDGDQTYWYSDGTIYYWKGAGYKEIASVPSDGFIVGIAKGHVYYWRYNDGKKELFQIEL